MFDPKSSDKANDEMNREIVKVKDERQTET